MKYKIVQRITFDGLTSSGLHWSDSYDVYIRRWKFFPFIKEWVKSETGLSLKQILNEFDNFVCQNPSIIIEVED